MISQRHSCARRSRAWSCVAEPDLQAASASSSARSNRPATTSSPLSARLSMDAALPSPLPSAAALASLRLESASSHLPPTIRLCTKQAKWRARTAGDRSGSERACRLASTRTSGESANMPAMLRWTAASCSGGSASRRDVLANVWASSTRPARCKSTAVLAASGPRKGCGSAASSKPRRLRSAAAPGSDPASALDALSSVVIATSSPGDEVAASCAATSTGAAPAANSRSAA